MKNLDNILKSLIPTSVFKGRDPEDRVRFASNIVSVFRENNFELYRNLQSGTEIPPELLPSIKEKLSEAVLIASKI